MTMPEKNTIADFLESNDQFRFHLVEYIESTHYAGVIQDRVDFFRRVFSRGPSKGSLWRLSQSAIEEQVRPIPAYEAIDWTRSDCWKSIPFTDKYSVRLSPDDFINPLYDRKKLWLRPTSGTTGSPVTIWYAPDFFFEFHLFSSYKIAWLAGGLKDDDRRRPVFCLALADNKYLPDRVWVSPQECQGMTLRVIFDERDPTSLNRFFLLLYRHQPAIITLKPNVLASIVRGLSEPPELAANHLRMIISSGADLSNELRKEGEAKFNVPICNAYGMSEFGIIASECDSRDGLHIYEQDFIPEVLLDSGQVSETGSGELIISSVINSAMPFLRYRTGDIVDLTSELCQCGRVGRRIRNISGRVFRNFRLRDGTDYSPTNLNNMFGLFPLREFQITQSSIDHIEGQFEFLSSCVDPDAELKRIRDYLFRELLGQVHVQTFEAKFCQSGKFQRYRILL